MRNLILFFVRYNAIFLFLLLETVSIYFLVQREPQRQIFFHSANQFTGSIFKVYDNVVQYTNLKNVNEELSHEIARFRNRDTSSFSLYYRNDFLTEDTIVNKRYQFIPATIINNSISRNNNYLTLDRGKKHGVAENTGVVSGTGIIGIVRKATNNYAAVMSVLHRDIRVSAELENSKYFGSLVWRGRNPRIMDLEAIPKHVPVVKGDTVVTSGFSSIFPANQLIGVVDTAWVEPGENFYTIKVELSCDLGKVEYAYVVKHLMREEQKEMEAELGYE